LLALFFTKQVFNITLCLKNPVEGVQLSGVEAVSICCSDRMSKMENSDILLRTGNNNNLFLIPGMRKEVKS